MKNLVQLLFVSIFLFSCGEEMSNDPIQQTDLSTRKAKISNFDGFKKGKSYLPMYSHIYHIGEHRTFDLTMTVSIRNISTTETVYLTKADYFNTAGENIRQYLKSPIYVKPMETLEIVIQEQDSEGGSGANFVFDWAMKNDTNAPLFEAVMISTYGQQGISFMTRGVRVYE